MASANPTDDRSAREHPDRSGEAFDWFEGGANTLADSAPDGRWRRSGGDVRRDDRSSDRGGRS